MKWFSNIHSQSYSQSSVNMVWLSRSALSHEIKIYLRYMMEDRHDYQTLLLYVSWSQAAVGDARLRAKIYRQISRAFSIRHQVSSIWGSMKSLNSDWITVLWTSNNLFSSGFWIDIDKNGSKRLNVLVPNFVLKYFILFQTWKVGDGKMQ